ncbi:hypothetical protein L4D08_23610 [Photobacterium chitinilyticum]|uniref:hypothetical protein n=1 Tax=Photobacterium chitinilyticum TaxID=2485123 RepID=UPI003D1057B1
MLRKLFGINEEDIIKPKNFEIEPEMINPDVVRMDMDSFRKSSAVKKQIAAAKRNVKEAETCSCS